MNNSGKTTLLQEVNRFYIQKNETAIFTGDRSKLETCVFIPAKRVFFFFFGGVQPNTDTLTMDVINNFGKEWSTGSFILSVREKIKRSPFYGKVSAMCRKILETEIDNVFNTKCSDGVQNIVNILSYIFHLLNIYTESNDVAVLLRTKFLLIIDEVELFLYTKSVVNFLEELFSSFKNLRLLISSHSALVMQRINSFHVLKIENKSSIVDIGPSPYFQDFGFVLENFYDIKDHPAELEAFISRLDDLLRAGRFDESELKPVFAEADRLRSRYPMFAELITNFQLNCYKRLKNNATYK